MSDEIDRANERAQQDLDRAIAAARSQVPKVEPLPTECANGCGSTPRERSRWCCAECRDEDEFRARQLKRQGAR